MNDKYGVIYSPEALEDLASIYYHIAFRLLANQTAVNQKDRIRNSICKLDTFPGRFPIVDWEPWKSAGMHKMPIDNYSVYYLIDENIMTVTIVRIFYAGRDVEDIIKSDTN